MAVPGVTHHCGSARSSTAEFCNNDLWILLIQTAACLGTLTVPPTPVPDLETFIRRAHIGPLMPGEAVLTIGLLYILSWVALALWIRRADERRIREGGGVPHSADNRAVLT